MGRRRHGGRAIGPRLSRVTKAAGARPPAGAGEGLPHQRKAAGAQITHSPPGEVVTKNKNTGLFRGPILGMSTL